MNKSKKYKMRKDEFRSTLDLDLDAMLDMNDEEREEYERNLVRRRNELHNRDINL